MALGWSQVSSNLTFFGCAAEMSCSSLQIKNFLLKKKWGYLQVQKENGARSIAWCKVGLCNSD